MGVLSVSVREQRVAEVRRLREQGLLFREIGGRLGIATNTAQEYFNDPDGAKVRARKEARVGVCVDCGGPTRNSGALAVPERCWTCGMAHRSTVQARLALSQAVTGTGLTWTDTEILDALRAASTDGTLSKTWYELWRASHAGPTVRTVVQRFGSWAAGVEAAGLSTRGRQRGPYANRLSREGALLAVQECAAEIGHPPTCVEYRAWARRVGAPSLGTVRMRVGSWAEALRRA